MTITMLQVYNGLPKVLLRKNGGKKHQQDILRRPGRLKKKSEGVSYKIMYFLL